MSERAAAIESFLRHHGWDKASRTPLPADASFRRYHRLTDGARRVLLMDAPPERESARAYVAVAAVLRRLGFSAPEVAAEDAAQGLLLIEDFGDDTYTQLLARGHDEAPLYTLATDLLIELQGKFRPPHGAGLPAYDDGRLLAEAALFVDWFLPQAVGRPTSAALREEYLALWRRAFPVARAVPDTLVLRDYHVDNLMLVPGRRGTGACGVLDFQDAVIGPVSYDPMSLLDDARRDVNPALVEAMRTRYLAAFPALDREKFAASYAVLGAQRHAKVIGIFTRLCVRDGKRAYLVHIPRVWRLFEASLGHEALAPMRAWLDRHVPAALRGIPRALAA